MVEEALIDQYYNVTPKQIHHDQRYRGELEHNYTYGGRH